MPIYLKSTTARRNMAWPKVIDGTEFESLKEYVEFREATEKFGGGRKSSSSGKPRKKKKGTGEYEDKYAQIVKSVGWEVLDPRLHYLHPEKEDLFLVLRESAREDGISQSQAILKPFGVTPAMRDAIHAEMVKAGVVCVGRGACHATTPAQKAQAAKILGKHINLPAQNNPRRRRRR